MPFDYGLRLDNRQRIANAGEKPIKANKNQAVDGAEGVFLRSGSPQNVYLLPQHPNFYLERCPRPKQICDDPNNEPDKISHHATASPDSRSTASQIEFATGTRDLHHGVLDSLADQKLGRGRSVPRGSTCHLAADRGHHRHDSDGTPLGQESHDGTTPPAWPSQQSAFWPYIFPCWRRS